MSFISQQALWKAPFTNKRYLHPPFSEIMFTMWPDLKIICGDVVEQTRGYISAGFRVLIGEQQLAPDFEKVLYHTRGDGYPIHSVTQRFDGYAIDMESFCSVERQPVCYSAFTIRCTGSVPVSDQIALLPRTGREDHLVGTEVDGYAHYDSNVHNWGLIPSGWRREGDLLTDGQYSILLMGAQGLDLAWQGDADGLVWYRRHLLRLRFTLAPGQSLRFTCAMRKGAVQPFDYDAEKAKAEAFWRREMSRLRHSPGGAGYAPLVNNLVAQCLQMFSYPVGKDYVLPRQGGLQRVIWPTEAIEFLMALDRIGDFTDYTRTAYDTFFFTLQLQEGADRGAVQNLSGQRWGNITGASVWGCARHILFTDSRAAYERYRENLYAAFEWMQAQREQTRAAQHGGAGLFPPMQASDWPGKYQSWCWTDAANLIGYRYLAEAFEHFGDPRAQQIRAAHGEYMACMRAVLAQEEAKGGREDEIRITNRVGVDLTDPPFGPYFSDGPAMLMRAGVIEAGSRTAERVEAFFRNRGMMRNGLTGLMNDGLIFQGHNSDPWAGHTWYTSFPDLCWFYNWLMGGQRDKAQETLHAQFKWGMSPQYYLLERYADNDPYWTPWMPNASANGRLLMMMCDFFAE